MEYVIIGACIVVAIAGGIVLYVKNKRTKNELEILYKISDLRYTLHLGTVSREQCMALLEKS